MNRLPTVTVKRQQWIESIQKHQKFENATYYNICRRHFHASNLVERNNHLELTPDAVPSIFNDIVIVNGTNIENDSDRSDCTELKALQSAMSKMSIDHNKTVHSLQNEITKLKKMCDQKDERALELIKDLSEAGNQLNKAEASMNNLKNEIKELKSHRYVPDNTPNVRIFLKQM